MRRILVDSARRRTALKRGGRSQKLPLMEEAVTDDTRAAEVIAVNDALDALQQRDNVAAELVKLHYFAGYQLKKPPRCSTSHEPLPTAPGPMPAHFSKQCSPKTKAGRDLTL